LESFISVGFFFFLEEEKLLFLSFKTKVTLNGGEYFYIKQISELKNEPGFELGPIFLCGDHFGTPCFW